MKEVKKSKINKIIIASSGLVAYCVAVSLCFSTYSKLIQIILLSGIALILALYSIGIFLKKERVYKIGIILTVVGVIGLILVTVVIRSHLFDNVDSAEELIVLINSFGWAGKAVFVLIQFLQVTLVPIPSTIVTAAGAALYSTWESIFLSCIGLWLGSFFAFFLGRTFGVKLVKWVVGEEMLLKYNSFVKGKDKAMLFYMFLFPAFPDDILCLIAGLTSMSYPSFFVIQLIARPLNVAGTVLLVDNIKSIPFSGWGIGVWILMGVLFVGVFILMWKYAEKLEKGMLKLISKITGKPIVQNINSIYKIKSPQLQPETVIKEKTPDEIYQETNVKLTDIVNNRKAQQLNNLQTAEQIAEKLLHKEDPPIHY